MGKFPQKKSAEGVIPADTSFFISRTQNSSRRKISGLKFRAV